MNKAMISLLTDAERVLLQATEPKALAQLDEDECAELLLRVRRARNKYSTNYRRQSARRVTAKGGRGAARGSNNKTRVKAEIFEDALSRVSRRLSVLARESAAELKAERLAAARGEEPTGSAARGGAGRGARGSGAGKGAPRSATPRTKDLRTPASTKHRASSAAAGARRQAKRDSR